MFEQLTELVKEFGGDAVVNNPAVPNEHNDAVMEEAGGSILSGLEHMVSSGNIGDLAGLLSGKAPIDMNNPVVKVLAGKLIGNLGEKFGLSTAAAGSVASGLIPQILGGLVNKAQDPNHPNFNITDLIGAVSGGNGGSLMDAVSKYGGQFGLDQDGDGQVGMGDAISAVTKNSGGLGGILGKLFGGK
jgi:Bacterial protein of unknown function (DUF937)